MHTVLCIRLGKRRELNSNPSVGAQTSTKTLSTVHSKPFFSFGIENIEAGLPPESLLESTMNSFSASDIAGDEAQILSRLSSANHDVIPETRPPVNPFLGFVYWCLSWMIPGAGMFLESYIIFSIGNITPLLKIDYPNCIGKEEPTNCNTNVVDELETIEIVGIIGGRFGSVPHSII